MNGASNIAVYGCNQWIKNNAINTAECQVSGFDWFWIHPGWDSEYKFEFKQEPYLKKPFPNKYLQSTHP